MNANISQNRISLIRGDTVGSFWRGLLAGGVIGAVVTMAVRQNRRPSTMEMAMDEMEDMGEMGAGATRRAGKVINRARRRMRDMM